MKEKMDRKVFNQLRTIIYQTSGISLSEKKENLVAARIGKRMRALGIQTHKEYLEMVKSNETGEEVTEMLDAISTNVTSFFREPSHFQFVETVFKQWLDQGQKVFRFWSAASSTGEEPYTLAMVIKETLGDRKVDLKILGTDINTKVLQVCRNGVYKKEKMASVPPVLRDRYADYRIVDGDYSYVIKPELKQLVSFCRLNLSKPPFPMSGPFDIVFCRNVMIYFDNDVRKRLLDELYRLIKPGGYLLVGHAESLTGMLSGFKAVKPSVYTKNNQGN